MTKKQRTLIKAEDLDAAIDELLSTARARGRGLRQAGRGRIFTQRPDKPVIDELLRADLRAALEDELLPAVEPGSNVSIDPDELSREVIKKALVGLKLATLREVARDRKVPASGNREDVASRIADAYNWDEEEVARLVLANEEEPQPDRGHVDRLFPLEEAVDLAYVKQRLDVVRGRYVRIGVARWFVFDTIGADDEEIDLAGTVRSYQADVSYQTGINEIEETPVLTAVPSEDRARIAVTPENLIRVRRATASAARAGVEALHITARLRPLRSVPLRGTSRISEAVLSLHPASLFMLDLLNTRLRQVGLRDLNLTIARFRVSAEGHETTEEFARRPSLHAVRFEGTHLLDSVPACELLSEEHRALVEIAIHVRTAPRPGREGGRFPIRIGLESDHVVVATGYGSGQPELSLEVHQAAVEAVRQEIQQGFADEERLHELALRIRRRATATQSPDEADMLADEPGTAETPAGMLAIDLTASLDQVFDRLVEDEVAADAPLTELE